MTKIETSLELPCWMPTWLWRFIHTTFCTSIAFGLTAYFSLSIVNDITGTIPLWVRLATQLVTTIIVFIVLTWKRNLDG